MSNTNGSDFSKDNGDCSYIMVTGANAGLGFAICCRLIDEFLKLRPPSDSLRLIITTRSLEKSSTTIKKLKAYIGNRQFPLRPARSSELPSPAQRISFQPEQVNLTTLHSVQSLSQTLLATLPKLDAIILNAGISGITGVHWLQAIWETLTDYLNSVTYPRFMIHSSGWTTKPQLSSPPDPTKDPEPLLGEIFCANVFGHYLLLHYLSPLLLSSSSPTLNPPCTRSRARIIWLSSLEAHSHTFTPTDLQALNTPTAYQSSKRLTDILALTASLPSTSPYTTSFFGSPPPNHPRMYLSHPGICATNILPLSLLAAYAKLFAFYIARWLGSPWHTATAYKGACAPVWLALAPQTTLDSLEEAGGVGKWGSSTGFRGDERVRRTEVEGWGFGGRVGDSRVFGGEVRKRGVVTDLTVEGKEEFEDLGRECWGLMEKLRLEWEERLR